MNDLKFISREAAKNAKRSEFCNRRKFLKRMHDKAPKCLFFAASREKNLLLKFAPICLS